MFKVAISDHRIIKVADGRVTFSYRKPKSRRARRMTLDASEFIRRFLEHSLPSGFMKVRYYGFLHGCSRVPLENIRASIEMARGFDAPEPGLVMEEQEQGAPVCPDCGGKLVYRYSVLPYQMSPWRSPG